MIARTGRGTSDGPGPAGSPQRVVRLRQEAGPALVGAPTDAATAFTASLAVGLIAAGWERDRAAAELSAAAEGDPQVLAAAADRVQARFQADPDEARRAAELLRTAAHRLDASGREVS